MLLGALVLAFLLWPRRPEILGKRLRQILGAQEGENVSLEGLLKRVPPGAQEQARTCVALYHEWRFAPDGASQKAPVVQAMKALKRAMLEAKRVPQASSGLRSMRK